MNSPFWIAIGEYGARSIKMRWVFLDLADPPFSIEAAQQAVQAGSKFVGKYDDIRFAARQVQEIHMRKMAPRAQHARTLLQKNPELGGEIAHLHEIGSLPHYGGISPGVQRPSGLPYDDAKTLLMVRKIWKDVRQGRVLVAHSDVIKPDAPLIPTTTTTVAKKLPDRTISTDVRSIPDLRLTNLFCVKEVLVKIEAFSL